MAALSLAAVRIMGIFATAVVAVVDACCALAAALVACPAALTAVVALS